MNTSNGVILSTKKKKTKLYNYKKILEVNRQVDYSCIEYGRNGMKCSNRTFSGEKTVEDKSYSKNEYLDWDEGHYCEEIEGDGFDQLIKEKMLPKD